MKTEEDIKKDVIEIIKNRFNDTGGYHKTVFAEAYLLGYNNAVADKKRNWIYRFLKSIRVFFKY